ncbi:MAG TPA: TonB-dependent receptor, partial [Burkholderiales bacterium]|nr:TonB-dependent receptor [Burkholderiales bacterium]
MSDELAAAQPVTLKPVEVINSTPLPGSDVPREHIPSNVQTLDAATLRQSNSLNVPEVMMNRLPSVNVNEVQGNSLQLDVNYRGFTASPLLGTSQGLSVYQDGVRINEPFGDIVNWDLIPMNAIHMMALMPGSNPLFGLNTLGGALVLQTKSGLTSPGIDASLLAGAFGRRKFELATGGELGTVHGFVAFSSFDEDGWREYSPSRARNAFAKIGQRLNAFDWDLALTYGRTRLVGNGLLPESMLTARREQIYTRPDTTNNTMGMAVLNAGYDVRENEHISGLVYLRRSHSRTLNGDVNDDYLNAGDPAGVENRTRTRQRGEGAALQWSRAGARYQANTGVTYDRSRSTFVQTESEGSFDATRAVIPIEEAEINAQLRGVTRNVSVYLTHTHSLRDNVQVTLAARYNVARVQTIDEFNPLSAPNLNGDYTY